jgi:hypothetical protein
MVQLAHRASLLLGFSLLTLATTVNAECAWVLWTKPPQSSSQSRALRPKVLLAVSLLMAVLVMPA